MCAQQQSPVFGFSNLRSTDPEHKAFEIPADVIHYSLMEYSISKDVCVLQYGKQLVVNSYTYVFAGKTGIL